MLGSNAVEVTRVVELAPVARIGLRESWRVGLSVIVCEVDIFVESEI